MFEWQYNKIGLSLMKLGDLEVRSIKNLVHKQYYLGFENKSIYVCMYICLPTTLCR